MRYNLSRVRTCVSAYSLACASPVTPYSRYNNYSGDIYIDQSTPRLSTEADSLESSALLRYRVYL